MEVEYLVEIVLATKGVPMDTFAERFFGIVFVSAFIALSVMTVLTDEDFIFQIDVPLKIALANTGLLVCSWVGLLVSMARAEYHRGLLT